MVRQTAANHAAIADLINELRQAKDTQVAIEARFVRVSAGYLEKIINDLDFYMNFHTNKITPSPLPVLQSSNTFPNLITGGLNSIAQSVTTPAMSITGSFLDDIQVNFLLQATQAHQDTRTLNAPRLTLISGTQAQIWVGETRQYVTNYTITVVEPNTGNPYVTASPTISSTQFGCHSVHRRVRLGGPQVRYPPAPAVGNGPGGHPNGGSRRGRRHGSAHL